jgi:hypothetical protein
VTNPLNEALSRKRRDLHTWITHPTRQVPPSVQLDLRGTLIRCVSVRWRVLESQSDYAQWEAIVSVAGKVGVSGELNDRYHESRSAMSSPRRWRSSLRIVVAEKVDTLTAALRQDAAHDGASDSPAAAEMHPNGDELLCAAGRPTTGSRGGRRAGGSVAASRRHTVRSPSPSSDVAARTTALDSRADQDAVRSW